MVHQAHPIMYCTRQVIQGENFHDWLKTMKTVKVFPLESFAVYSTVQKANFSEITFVQMWVSECVYVCVLCVCVVCVCVRCVCVCVSNL